MLHANELEYFLQRLASQGGEGASTIVVAIRKHIEALEARNKELEAELADWEASFDVYHAADARAVKRWQAAHPGTEMVHPDKTELGVWLVERIVELESAVPRLADGSVAVEDELVCRVDEDGDLRRGYYHAARVYPISGENTMNISQWSRTEPQAREAGKKMTP